MLCNIPKKETNCHLCKFSYKSLTFKISIYYLLFAEINNTKQQKKNQKAPSNGAEEESDSYDSEADEDYEAGEDSEAEEDSDDGSEESGEDSESGEEDESEQEEEEKNTAKPQKKKRALDSEKGI